MNRRTLSQWLPRTRVRGMAPLLSGAARAASERGERRVGTVDLLAAAVRLDPSTGQFLEAVGVGSRRLLSRAARAGNDADPATTSVRIGLRVVEVGNCVLGTLTRAAVYADSDDEPLLGRHVLAELANSRCGAAADVLTRVGVQATDVRVYFRRRSA